jgi:drug/metabolite transporter (DMT)-like permease
VYPENLRLGALYMIAAGLLFATMAAIVRYLSASLPNEMIVFFRSAMGLAVLFPWLWHRGLHNLKTARPGGHLLRGLAGLGAMYCFFYAIAHLPLAEATLLNYSTPLFMPFIALWWLHEGMARRLWWGIGIGFCGIVLILKPGMGIFSPVALIGLASGVLAAVAMVGVRRLSRTEPTSRIVFYFTLVSACGSAIPLAWAWQTPPVGLWFLLIAMGALASMAQLLMTRAYSHAPAAQVGPFTYTTVVFAALAGWLGWGEVLDWVSAAGALLVMLGGAITIRFAGRRAAPTADVPASPTGNPS